MARASVKRAAPGVVRTAGALAVTFVVRSLRILPVMNQPWDLTLTVDAIGHDDSQIQVVRAGPHGLSHLKVRTGSLLVHCLDGNSVTTMAQAWATAKVRAQELLPDRSFPVRREAAEGASYPVGEVVMEGRQRWTVTQPHDGDLAMVVTVGCLQVRVHDRVALDTQLRVWAAATAHGGRLFPGRTPAFNRLVEQARIAEIERATRAHDLRGHGRRPGPERP